jgi:hypothetical protein
MNTFKKSAIKILKKAKTPLHYTEITRLALEPGILETEEDKRDAGKKVNKESLTKAIQPSSTLRLIFSAL